MADLETYGLGDMVQLGAALRGLEAASMEALAGRCTRLLYEQLTDGKGEHACALVRFFKTHAYDRLPAALQAEARRGLGGVEPPPGLRCLTLLATTGARPEWCDRARSTGHRAIPLVDAGVVRGAPMIAGLVDQLGLDDASVVAPSPDLFRARAGSLSGVFHVEDAVGSPWIPAQAQFVVPAGVRSAVGFGGLLSTGELYSMLLFTTVHVAPHVAALFKTMAINLRIAVLPIEGAVFA